MYSGYQTITKHSWYWTRMNIIHLPISYMITIQVFIHIVYSKESWTMDIPIPNSHSVCHSQNEQWPPQMTMMDLKIHALKKLCLVQHFLFFNFIFNHHEFQIQSPCQWRIDLRTIQNGLPPCFLRFHCLAKDGAAGHLLPVGCRHGRDH